jgi:hypothetical protein
MNDRQLNAILRSAPVPERTGDYWERFPRQVSAEIRRRESTSANTVGGTTPSMPDLWQRLSRGFKPAFGAGFALACAVLAITFGLWHRAGSLTEASQILAAEKYLQEIEKLFPNQVEAIAFDQHGARMVISDHPDVPDSQPLYLKICGPQGCQRFITFSGQQVRVNGDVFDVLVDRRGAVLVVGEQWVWSSSSPAGAGRYRIAARLLPAAS